MKRVSDFAADLGSTLKSIVKIALQSRPVTVGKAVDAADMPLVILANGPSLRQTITDHGALLESLPTLAVNFAANAPEFTQLKPRYYVLADPHFVNATDDPNVKLLFDNLRKVTCPMRLFVDRRYRRRFVSLLGGNANISVETFNAVGAEGFAWFERLAYRSRLAMPRPRNVLIPSIMIGIMLGYRRIFICGADHSWMRDLRVTDDNEVVSGMSHFYKESSAEVSRSRNEYRSYRLHDIIRSYYVAFLSYHKIRRFADSLGVEIINATPGSYIDAFKRGSLAEQK